MRLEKLLWLFSDCPRAAQSGRGYLVSCLVTARRLSGAADWCNGIPARGCAAYYFGIRDNVLERPYSTGRAHDLYVGRFLVHALECDFPRAATVVFGDMLPGLLRQC